MFSYYGSKSKIVSLYPKPRYNLIIEPFAGCAWYSLLYSDNQVILNEKYDKIFGIWNWLVNRATKEQILSNRNFTIEQDISKLNLHQEHKDLIGFCINRGSTAPRNIVQKWSYEKKTLGEIAKICNISYKLLFDRINYKKMTLENALMIPVKRKRN